MSNANLLATEPQGLLAITGADVSQRAFALQRGFNELFQLYGHSCDAPRSGETDEQYMRRGLNSAKRFSPTWAQVDFNSSGVTREALPVAYDQVVTGGIATFKRSGAGTGPLREVVERDPSGRPIHRFYGDPEACWGPIKAKPQYVTGWSTDLARGRHAPGAVRPIGTLMSDGTVRKRV
jgi:hypothetical protein